MIKKSHATIAALLASLLLPSCSLITKPTEMTSETIVETTTDGTSDMTSSTSSDENDSKEVDVVAEKFVQSNLNQLRADMATGEGEYLTTLASLLNISEAQKEPFYALAKLNFDQIFSSSETTAKEIVRNSRKVVSLTQI